jgi:hypothetical protein
MVGLDKFMKAIATVKGWAVGIEEEQVEGFKNLVVKKKASKPMKKTYKRKKTKK